MMKTSAAVKGVDPAALEAEAAACFDVAQSYLIAGKTREYSRWRTRGRELEKKAATARAGDPA